MIVPLFDSFRKRANPLLFLNIALFISAINDNLLKLLIAYWAISKEGVEKSAQLLSFVGVLYVLPFLLFSSTFGVFADKFSKKSVLLFARCCEFISLLISIVALKVDNLFLGYFSLFLLATQSSLFSPCKYGIIPEIVQKKHISRANGVVSSLTYIGVIIGTFLASFLTEVSNRSFIFAVCIQLILSLCALCSIYLLPKTHATAPNKRPSWRFITAIFRNLKKIYQVPFLLCAVYSSAFFLFIGSFVQLNLIPFGIDALDLTYVQSGYLFLLTAFGIGIGAYFVGRLSGKHIRLGFSPIGCFGITCCCLLLAIAGKITYCAYIGMFLLGVFGGIYLVPLDSFIQQQSPEAMRGEVVATVNFWGFFGILLSSLFLYTLSVIFELSAQHSFFAIAAISGSVTLILTFVLSQKIRLVFTNFLNKNKN